MKFLFTAVKIVVVLLIIISCCHTSVNPSKYKIPKKDRIDAAMKQEHMMTMDCKTGTVPRRTLLKSSSSLKIIEQENASRNSSMNLSWHERGPNNVGGRTRAILVDQSDPTGKTVFAAGVSGGLWKTTNITSTDPSWQNVDDFFGSLSICTIAQDPSNHSVLYFGTGEGYFENDAVPGMGIWKSTNGGATWTHLTGTNNDDFMYVQKIELTPDGSVFATTFHGVQRSTNGGQTWVKVLGSNVGGASSEKANDLEIASDGTIYVSMGLFEQDGIYKSSNNGASWTKLSSGLPSNGYSRIELALATSNETRLYALFEDANSKACQGIYKSSNSGSTWVPVTNPSALGMSNFARSQAWYNLTVEVDPTNEEHVYIGGIDLLKTSNGGMTWTQVSQWGGLGGIQYVHADQHCLSFIDGNKLLIGNDGGIYYTSNASSSMPVFYPKNKGYKVTQFYAATAHPNSGSNYFVAGAQDNGTQKFAQAGLNETTEISGGDGARCYIDKDNPNVQITSYVFNNYFLSTNGGASFSFVNINDFGLFANATDYDHTANKLYGASEPGKIIRWNDPATGGSSYSNITLNGINGDQVTFIKVSPNVANRIYVGTDGGDVYSVDQVHTGTSKTALKIRDDIDGYVSSIDVLPSDENTILVSYSNYNHNNIYLTQNAGTIWNSIEGNLPNIPVRDVIFNPEDSDKAIIATELGVWITDDLNGASTYWIPNNTGLAQVRVDDLFYRESDKLLLAATHGRGLFTSQSFGGTEISFEESSYDVMEMDVQSLTGTCSEDYYDFTLPVKITANPSTNEVVNVSVVYSHSDVTLNRDFQLMTSQLIFTPSGSMTQNVQVRLIDDAIEEGIENLRITLSPQNASLGEFGFIDVAIRDNDYDVLGGSGNGAVEFGNGSTSQDDYPFRGYYEDEKTQILFRATELMGMGLQAGNINALALNVKNKKSNGVFNGFNIKMGHTSLNDVNQAGVPFEQNLQSVYSSAVSTVVGWNTFDFDSSFQWDGTSNIIVEMCYNNSNWSNDDEMYCTPTNFNSVQYRYTDGNIGCNLTTVQKNANIRPDTRFYQAGGSIDLADGLSSKNSYMSGNETAHFYKDGKLILSVKNKNAQNIACISAEIDRAGLGKVSVPWLGGKHVSEKTFYIDADNDVSYDVTLYYSADELATWSDPENLSLVKTDVPIDEYGGQGINFVDNASLDIQDLPGGGKSFTASFDGFSGFAISNFDQSVVPLSLLSFKAIDRGDLHELKWRVENEFEMDEYLVQKSTDGILFDNIGSVNAENKEEQHDYSFNDKEIQDFRIFYYRLKMIGFDGNVEYSEIRSITREISDDISLRFYPNPVKHELNILLEGGDEDTEIEKLEIRGIKGELVKTYNSSISIYERISISDLTPGTYVLFYRLTEGEEGFVRISKVD